MSFRRSLPIAAALLTAALACVATTHGAVRVDILTSPKDAAPGEIVTHVFAVSHDGATAETFALTVGSPPGWSVLGVPPEIVVAPGEERTVSVTLAVPSDALPGPSILTLRATSTDDPTDEASAGIATRISAVNQVELTPPDGQNLAPGGTASYSVRVTNRGNAQDSVAVSATSSRGYAVAGAVASLELSPLESREIVVVLAVPADAAPGRDVLTVRAGSTLYAGVEDEIAILTTVLPPGPEAAVGSLYEVLPARISLEIERDETAGTFDSRASVALSGVVFDGTFAASLLALHPFGSGPVDITDYSVSYRLDAASFAVGEVSQTLTDLHSISCEGGSTSVDAALVDVALIAGGEGDETRFGGLIAGGPEEAQAGIAYSDCRDDVSRSAAWTGFARAEPMDGWILRAEGGVGTVGGKRGVAGFLGTSLDTDSYFLSAAAFSVDTYFPGPRNDSAGVEASQRLRLETFSLGLSLAHAWNDVVRDPVAPTLVTDSLGVNASATPWDDGPTLQGTITFERTHQADGVPRDDVDALLAYSVADGEGTFPYGFSGRIADRCDLLLGTRERTLTHTQEVGLSVDELTVLLQLSEEQVVDLTHHLVLSSTGSATLVVQPAGAPHEASVAFRSVDGRHELEASLALHLMDDLGLTLGGFSDWERGDPSAARFGWSLQVDAAWGIPLPFLVTKGRIEGRVFVDRNADGVFDEGDSPAAGAVVFVESDEVSTNAEGLYRFPPLAPGAHSLAVRELPRAASFQGPIDVRLRAGEHAVVDVPLAPILTVRGVVSDDASEDEARQTQETGLPDARVVLLGDDGAQASAAGAPAADEAQASTAGAPAADEAHALTAEAPASVDEAQALTAEAPASVDEAQALTAEAPAVDEAQALTAEAPASVDETQASTAAAPAPVGEAQASAARPPVADFAYSPVLPTAGQPVAFDAAASVDFDGEIEVYAWDFDGDGTVDAEGVAAEWIFPAAGSYAVALTVVDAAGMRGVVRCDVDVAPVENVAVILPAAVRARFAYEPRVARAGETIRFDATASVGPGGQPLIFAWDFDGDGASDRADPESEWSYGASGSHPVTLTVTAPDGSTASLTLAVPVVEARSAATSIQLPIASIQFAPPSPRVGEPVLWNAMASVDLDGSIVGYAWDFDADGFMDSTQPIVVHAFATAGTTVVELTVFDDAGLSDTVTVPIVVE